MVSVSGLQKIARIPPYEVPDGVHRAEAGFGASWPASVPQVMVVPARSIPSQAWGLEGSLPDPCCLGHILSCFHSISVLKSFKIQT